jgi:hypothetical protein
MTLYCLKAKRDLISLVLILLRTMSGSKKSVLPEKAMSGIAILMVAVKDNRGASHPCKYTNLVIFQGLA